jgi:hypothetical protein
MKTPYRTLAFVVLAVIVTVTVFSCSKRVEHPTKQDIGDQMFILEFGKKIGFKKTEYAEVKDKENFIPFLTALCKKRAAQFEIEFKRNDNSETKLCCDIKTGEITPCPTLKKDEPARESAVNDPHATYRVRSNDPKDIRAVLDKFKEPTPTPSPTPD